jgi:uncharacterized protein (TIGR00369 family)
MEGYEEMVRFMEREIPFNEHMGVEVVEIRPGYASLKVQYKDQLLGDAKRPALHGGVISALVDACGGLAVWSNFTLSERIATIDLRVDFLRPAGKDRLTAESFVRLLGNRVGNVSTLVYSGEDRQRPVAEGRSVYNIRRIGS